MASEEGTCCQKGNVTIVGVRLTATSREVLTWTLAKFTNPGDTVIALHVTSSSPHADSSRTKADSPDQEVTHVLDSVMGVYEGFCSIKQIDLQVKVINNPSLKKALVQEANAYGATKLILGITNKQLALGTTFSLAKYCSKRVPSTCSVIVIEHGRVVFEREGSQLNLEAKKHGMLLALPRSIQSRSWKGAGRCAGERNVMLERGSKTKRQTMQSGCPHSDNLDSKGISNHCSYQIEFPNSPVSVLHTYKYVPPHMEVLRPCLPKRSAVCPLCTAGSAFGVTELKPRASVSEYSETALAASRVDDGNLLRNSSEVVCEQTPSSKAEDFTFNSHDYSNLQESERQPTLTNDILNSQGSKQKSLPVQELLLEPCPEQEQHVADCISTSGLISFRTVEEPFLATKNTTPGPGWPLLHRSISLTKVSGPLPTTRRMSVVEWALQLPDRHMEIAQQLEATEKNDSLLVQTHLNCQPQQDCIDTMSCRRASVATQVPYIVSDNDEFQVSAETSCELSQITFSQIDKCMSADHCDTETSLAEKVDNFCKDKSCTRFLFQELEAATCNFSPGKLVGKGGCSSVYQGVLLDGRVVAVKCLNTSVPDAEQELLTEVEIISSLCHRHIVTLIGYCVDSQNYLLVYNFMSEGNLEQSLYGRKGRHVLSWEIRRKVATGIAEALDYLHDGCARPVVHRDVKSSNILLSSDFEPQLTDFGLAKWAPTTSINVTCSDVVGTFGYLAPEYFMYGKVNEKTDVYSFGVVLLELITGRQPIDTSRPKGQENLVMWAKKLLEDDNSVVLIDPQLEGAYDASEMRSMILAAALCLRQSPHCRPRMSRILKLLNGEGEELGNWAKQELILSKEFDEGYDIPNYGDCDIRTHLTLALLGLDDDVASQASTEQSLEFAHSKCPEEYFGGRYSRTCSFD